jgi:hypothetical protein
MMNKQQKYRFSLKKADSQLEVLAGRDFPTRRAALIEVSTFLLQVVPFHIRLAFQRDDETNIIYISQITPKKSRYKLYEQPTYIYTDLYTLEITPND